MTSLLANRIVFLLACVGLGLTLFLGLAHTSGASVPCGAHNEGVLSGCDKVAQDGWSHIFGISVAFLGTLMYLAVGCLAWFREVVGIDRSVNLMAAMWIILGVGVAVAGMMLGRTYYIIEASCLWCVASHCLTFTAFLVHSFGNASRKPASTPGRVLPWFAFPVMLALAAGVGAGPGWKLLKDQRAKHDGGSIKLDNKQLLVREYSPVLGPPDAKITIVVFSDLHCPICKHWHTWLEKEIHENYEGKVRLVFRNFPIAQLHPHATTAALYGEYARRHNKFWEFVQMNYENQEGVTQEKLQGFLDQLGLDSTEAAGIINDETKLRDYLKNVHQDMDDGMKLGVNQTPWWFIEYPNGDLEYAMGDGIERRVESQKFQTAVREK